MAETAKILLIDDDQKFAQELREKLISRQGYFVYHEPAWEKALNVFKSDRFNAVITKFDLSDFGTLELIKNLKIIDPDCIIITITEGNNSILPEDTEGLGVYDVMDKPLDLERLYFDLEKGVALHAFMADQRKLVAMLKEQNISLQKQNLLLAKRIDESTRNLTRLYEDLRSTYMRTIKALAQAIDARDHYTHSHSENVAKIAVAIAAEMELPARDVDNIRQASELHDLGKIGIEDSILTKPSSLTAEEWERVKRHPQVGAQILEPLTFLNEVIELVRQHHEHYDGSGYPKGLKGEEILIGARIIHLADAYETMRSERAYRKIAFSKQEAIAEIKSHSGTQFCPKVTEAFLKVVDKL